LADVWQLHYAVAGGKDHNVAESLIANADENSDGHFIKVEAEADGSFTVSNSRDGVSRKYSQK